MILCDTDYRIRNASKVNPEVKTTQAIRDKPSPPKRSKTVYENSTDEASSDDDDPVHKGEGTMSDVDLPKLMDLFSSKIFFLSGDFDKNEKRTLNRYIIAYNGFVVNMGFL